MATSSSPTSRLITPFSGTSAVAQTGTGFPAMACYRGLVNERERWRVLSGLNEKRKGDRGRKINNPALTLRCVRSARSGGINPLTTDDRAQITGRRLVASECQGMSGRSYIVDDRERKTFLLDREVLVSEEVLRQELSRIFGRCWIYVGHASELKRPGDFRSRKV